MRAHSFLLVVVVAVDKRVIMHGPATKKRTKKTGEEAGGDEP